MSKAGRRTRRRKPPVDAGVAGPSIADYYRFLLLLPGAGQPSYEGFRLWRSQV